VWFGAILPEENMAAADSASNEHTATKSILCFELQTDECLLNVINVKSYPRFGCWV